jgi:hypothetical protein
MCDEHTKRQLSLARWNAREAIARESMGETETAASHLLAASEHLAQITGRFERFDCAGDLMVRVLETADQREALLDVR